jgi:DNA polymerase I-like protein with 3'-5' exonuclease and polymerase domains
MDTIWEQDLERAIDMVYEDFPDFTDEREMVEIIDDLRPLEAINNFNTHFSFDFETTGLKPHRKGHRIVAASVATNEKAYAFLIPKTRKEQQPFLDLLKNPRIGKWAHNAQFEDTWAAKRLYQPVVNWEWDSMLASHILRNDVGNNGLKFQTYVNFGIDDYASRITPFLKSDDPKNSNSFNRIYDAIEQGYTEDLLMYCGLDSVYEHMLAQKQRKELGFV